MYFEEGATDVLEHEFLTASVDVKRELPGNENGTS
jgi:hypothetical protein